MDTWILIIDNKEAGPDLCKSWDCSNSLKVNSLEVSAGGKKNNNNKNKPKKNLTFIAALVVNISSVRSEKGSLSYGSNQPGYG